MPVGLLTLELHIAEAQSLKDKRQVIRSLKDRLRASFNVSVAELEATITAYIDATNADPKPFRWTKSADDILASIQRFCLRALAANA